jgi:general secretion pathway protein G
MLPTALSIALLCSCEDYPVTRAKEDTLRQELIVLRSEIKQYTSDHDKRPGAISDLVIAGYLKKIPIDPFTGRNDTWVPQWSTDPKQPGIANIHSGSQSFSRQGRRYSEW